jgi:carboxylesterase type B
MHAPDYLTDNYIAHRSALRYACDVLHIIIKQLRMIQSLVVLLASAAGILADSSDKGTPLTARADDPIVTVQNGSYVGLFDAEWDQDQFRGIPFAQPPLDNLRFRVPQSLNSSWEGTRPAQEWGSPCYQYDPNQGTLLPGNIGSDDCLTLNVYRPAGVDAEAALPVAVWIHGGGLSVGASSDPAASLSFIVDQAVQIGKPIVAVSINYRLFMWGYLWGSAIAAEGAGNLGYRDQRLALRWVQENIGSFGGDPEKVTIWGQSGGARSVASQLTAYGGRDEGLFRAAILQSGSGFITDFGETGSEDPMIAWDAAYTKLLSATGCNGTSSETSLDCLRKVPSLDLAKAMGGIKFPSILDIIDGDFIRETRSEAMNRGNFVHLPYLTGTTTDDGDYFARPLNTTEQWNAWLREGGASNKTIQELSALYPDDPKQGLPETLPGRPTGSLAALYGLQWKRALVFGGDRAMQGPRRALARLWTSAGLKVYSYRFNVFTADRSIAQGIGHSSELSFLFGKQASSDSESFVKLAKLMARQWASFVATLDPNAHGYCSSHWPAYDEEEPQNLVFEISEDGSSVSHREPDVYRQEQLAYLDSKLWQTGLESS